MAIWLASPNLEWIEAETHDDYANTMIGKLEGLLYVHQDNMRWARCQHWAVYMA